MQVLLTQKKQVVFITIIIELLAGTTTYSIRNSQFGGSLINAETVNAKQLGDSIQNNNA